MQKNPALLSNIFFVFFSIMFRRIQQIPVRVSRTLRDQSGLLVSQQLPTDLSPGPGRTPHQLRLLGRGVRPRAEQRHRVGGQPAPQQPARLPGPDPALPLPGLRQRLSEPGCAQQVQHQVHPERHTQPAQHVRARGRLQVQTDPHLRSLEPEPLAVFSWGHFIYW